MDEPLAYHGVEVLGDCIYVIGGYNGISYVNTCKLLDTKLKTWRTVTPMIKER